MAKEKKELDERKERFAFERWLRRQYGKAYDFARDPDLPGSYVDPLLAASWAGWIASARIANR